MADDSSAQPPVTSSSDQLPDALQIWFERTDLRPLQRVLRDDLLAGRQPLPVQQTDEEFAADPELAQRVAVLRAQLLTRDQLEEQPDPEWLLDDWVVEGALTYIYGKYGSAKSFLALDWACCIATGRSWNGHEIVGGAGPVLYLAAEGATGIKKRVQAWELTTGTRAEQLFVFPRPVLAAATSGYSRTVVTREWRDFMALARELRPRAVFIDTQARCTPGLDENGQLDMGVFVQAASLIREEAHSTPIVIHHTGHGGGDMRGSSALHGAADTKIKVELNKPSNSRPGPKHVTVESDKQKDEQDQPKTSFTLHRVGLGNDSRGKQTTSAVLLPGAPEWVRDARPGPDEHIVATVEDIEGRVLELVTNHSQLVSQLELYFDFDVEFSPAQWSLALRRPRQHIASALRPLIEAPDDEVHVRALGNNRDRRYVMRRPIVPEDAQDASLSDGAADVDSPDEE